MLCPFLPLVSSLSDGLAGWGIHLCPEVHVFVVSPQLSHLENSVSSVLPTSRGCCEDQIPWMNIYPKVFFFFKFNFLIFNTLSFKALCDRQPLQWWRRCSHEVGVKGGVVQSFDSRVTSIQIQLLPLRSSLLPVLRSHSSCGMWITASTWQVIAKIKWYRKCQGLATLSCKL